MFREILVRPLPIIFGSLIGLFLAVAGGTPGFGQAADGEITAPAGGEDAAGGGGEETAAAETEIVARILKDWKDSQDAMRSVRYVTVGTMTIPKGTHTGKPGNPPGAVSPPEDVVYEVRRNWLIDFEHGLVRRESWDQVWLGTKQEFFPMFNITVFDGEVVKKYRPQKENTSELHKPTDDMAEMFVADKGDMADLRGLDDKPVYYAHGMVAFAEGQSTSLKASLDPKLLSVAAEEASWRGDDPETVALEMRFPDAGVEFRFRMDPRLQSRVTYAALLRDEKLSSEMNVEYQETDFGWLIKRWDVNMYQGGKPYAFQTLEVTDFLVNPEVDDSQFQLEPRPGSVMVADGRPYRVHDDGQLTPVYGGPGAPVEERRPLTPVERFLVGLTILAGAILVLALIGHFRRRGAKSPNQ